LHEGYTSSTPYPNTNDIWAIDYTPAAVPEPSTLVLLATGLFVFAIRRDDQILLSKTLEILE